MDQSSLFWPNQVVTIPLPQVPGWPDEPNKCNKPFFFVFRLSLPPGRFYWAVVCHHTPIQQFMSHRGTWEIIYLSEHISESVFDSSKWFLISFIDVIIIFVNLLLFFIAFLYVKGVKKRNKKKLKQFKT